MVNTAAPQIPAALAKDITGIVGLSGLSQEHSMLRRAATTPTGTIPAGTTPGVNGPVGHAVPAPAGTPQACSGAVSAAGATDYTSTAAGRRLRAEPAPRPGPHRYRRDHRHRGVRAVLPGRHRRLRGLLRPRCPGTHGRRRRDPGRADLGVRRGGPRHRAGRGERSVRLHRRLRGAERDRRLDGARPLQPHRRRRRGPGRHHQLGLLRAAERARRGRPRRARSSSAWPCRGRPWSPRPATRDRRTASTAIWEPNWRSTTRAASPTC